MLVSLNLIVMDGVSTMCQQGLPEMDKALGPIQNISIKITEKNLKPQCIAIIHNFNIFSTAWWQMHGCPISFCWRCQEVVPKNGSPSTSIQKGISSVHTTTLRLWWKRTGNILYTKAVHLLTFFYTLIEICLVLNELIFT